MYKMKNAKCLRILMLILSFKNMTYGQAVSEPNWYLRVVIEDANSLEKAAEIDEFMRGKQGVITTRMDRRTSLYLCIYNANVLTSASILQWIEGWGYSPSCKVEGIHGHGEPVKPISLTECRKAQVLRNEFNK